MTDLLRQDAGGPRRAVVVAIVVVVLGAGLAIGPFSWRPFGGIPSSSSRPGSMLGTEPPPADPRPWQQVVWREVAQPFVGPAEATSIDGLVKGNGTLLAYGRVRAPGRNEFDDMSAVFLSADGERWRSVAIDTGVGPQDTSYIHFAAVGAGGMVLFGETCCEIAVRAIWHSVDGGVWRRVPLDAGVFGDGWPVAVVAAGSGFIAVGQQGEGRGAIWTSRDGRSWALVDRVAAEIGRGGINDVAFRGVRRWRRVAARSSSESWHPVGRGWWTSPKTGCEGRRSGSLGTAATGSGRR